MSALPLDSHDAASDRQPRFRLTGASAWLVESGHVDVFAVVARGPQAGQRRHLLRAGPGDMLGGMADTHRVVLQGVTAFGTSCRALGPDWYDELARQVAEDGCAAPPHPVQRWVDGLVDALAARPRPEGHIVVRDGAELTVPEPLALAPADGMLWGQLASGTVRVCGRDDFEIPASAVVPCTATAWCELTAGGELTMHASPGAGGLPAERALEPWHAAVLVMLERWFAQEAANELAQREKQLANARQDLQEACQRIAWTFNPSSSRSATPGTPPIGDAVERTLLAVCRLVGERCGVDVIGMSVEGHRDVRDALQDVARTSKFRIRPVSLSAGWWRRSNGPLVAFTREGRRPVALMPATRWRYVLHDPLDNRTVDVDETVAATLMSSGYTFYRTFPPTALTILDLLKFGIRGSGRDLAFVAVLGVCGGILTTSLPIATGILINDVIPGARDGQIEQWVMLVVACATATVLLQVTRGLTLARVEMRMGVALQAAVWDRLLSLPLTFFKAYSSGALAIQAMNIDGIRQTLSGAALRAILTGALSVFNFGLLFHYNATLAFYAVLLILCAVATALLVGYLQFRQQRISSQLRTKTHGVVLQLLSGITKLRVGGAENRAFVQWARLFSQQRASQFNIRTWGNVFSVFDSVFPVLCSAVLFTVLIESTQAANIVPGSASLPAPMSTGDVLAFLAAFAVCLSSTLGTASALISVLVVVPMYEQAKPILQAVPEVTAVRRPPGKLRGEIRAERLHFRYAPDAPPILQDVSFHIKPGQFVAFVGPSGSGKSTLLRLLLGFETPQSGAVLFDGLDLQRIDVEAVRRQTGVVLQNGRLMPGDIYTNISGGTSITVEEAWEAARMAGLDADLKAMPMGLHTMVNDNAGTLSGGQRQRLMIARAIVHRPKILFFDEATSALDNRTQAIVSESLERLQATRVVIAHRLSTIVNADRIFVVDRGTIAQAGTFKELVAMPGPFAELAKRQMM